MRCKGKTKSGKRCSANALKGSKYCFYHDPARKNDLRAAQSKGGKTSNKWPGVLFLPAETPDVDLKTPDDVRLLISDTISRLRRGEVHPDIASKIGYLAQVGLRSLEQSELEKRISKLEEKIIAMKGSNDVVK